MAVRFPSTRPISTCASAVVVVLLCACSMQQVRTSEALAVMSSVAYSPDGKSIAAARGRDNGVFIYDASTLKRVKVLLGKDESLSSNNYYAEALAYSRDGALLATSGIDDSFILWDAKTGQESLRIPQLKGAQDVAFSPTSDLLATAGPGKDVILWEVGKGKPAAVLKGHSAAVTTVTFSPDGKLLASGGEDGMVILWSVDAARQVSTLGPLPRPVRSLSFSRDARMLATCDGKIRQWTCDGEIKLWVLGMDSASATLSEPVDIPSKVEVSTHVLQVMNALALLMGRLPIDPHETRWGPAIFSPDGKHLAVKRGHISLSGDYEIVVLDVPSRKVVAHILCQCFGMAFSPDGTRLATAGHPARGGPVQQWDVNTGKEIRLFH